MSGSALGVPSVTRQRRRINQPAGCGVRPCRRLGIGRIMGVVRRKPVSTGEISKDLGLDPLEVTRHIQDLAHQGIVRVEEGQGVVAAD